MIGAIETRNQLRFFHPDVLVSQHDKPVTRLWEPNFALAVYDGDEAFAVRSFVLRRVSRPKRLIESFELEHTSRLQRDSG